MTGSGVEPFQFDGHDIPWQEGDTLASALHRAGIRTISRSMKYHRPRGAYCFSGSCAGCYVDVDGTPNVPACMVAAEPCTVRSQNRVGSAETDLLSIVDKVYRHGFDPHNAFTKIRPVNAMFLKAVRTLSGWGQAPEQAQPRPTKRETRAVDELIIGAGAGGLARAAAAKGKVLLVEEGRAVGGGALWDPSEAVPKPTAETLTEAVAFGIYGDTVAIHHGTTLLEVKAKRVTLALGSHDAWPLFGNNDLPGVMSLRGARRLLFGHGVLPGLRVVGTPHLPEDLKAAIAASGGTLVAEGTVTQVGGSRHVERALVDGQRVACDAVICNLPGTPRIELYQQAGCELHFKNGVLQPKLNAKGQTTVRHIFGVLP